MSFTVQPAAIDGFAASMTELSADSSIAKDYLSTHLNLVGVADSGLFVTILGTNDDVKTTVGTMINRLDALSAGSSRELSKTADSYRSMDAAAAARIDATYPVPGETDPGLDETTGTTPVEFVSPVVELVPPVATDPIPDLVQWIFSFPDLVSPSHWLLWALDQICGVNPADWFAGEFAGDWEAVQKAGRALESVGDFTQAYATEIRNGAGSMLARWNGNAAEAAELYFAALADAVGAQTSPLGSIGTQYAAVAYGMWSAAQAIVALIEGLLDWALIAAASAAAAVASSWTIIGGIAGAAATALAIGRAVEIWFKVIEVHGIAAASAQGFTGLVTGFLGAVRGLDEYPLPAGAYDHPGV